MNADGDTAITVADAPGGGEGLVPGDRYSVLIDAPEKPGDITALQGGRSTLDADRYPALVEWAEMQEQPRTGAGYLELIDRLRSRGYLSHALLEDASAAGGSRRSRRLRDTRSRPATPDTRPRASRSCSPS